MSFLDRLNRIVRSNISDLRGDSRPQSLDRVLGEMESSLRDARREKAQLRKAEKKLVARIRQARDKADQWEERAMMALKKGEEDLAKDALVVRNEALDEAAGLREELEEHRMYLQDIDSALEALEMKLEGTRSRLRASAPSSSGRPRNLRHESDWDREFRRRVQGRGEEASGPTPSGRRRSAAAGDEGDFGAGRILDEMDRMGSKIDAYEAEVEAMRELSDENLSDPERARLERRFRDLEGRRGGERREGKDVDSGRDNLADLKEKFKE